MTDGSNKAKKQVKIKDIVQFKLPDEDYYQDVVNYFLQKNFSKTYFYFFYYLVKPKIDG